MSPQTLFNVITFNSLAVLFPISVIALWRFPKLYLHFLTVFLGVLTGMLSARTDDMVFPVLLLLVFSFFAGFQHPRNAWQFALLLAIWVPGLEITSTFIGAGKHAISPVPGSLLAFVPAFLGTYLGVLVNRLAGVSGLQFVKRQT